MNSMGISNDAISSIKVPKGLQINLFEHSGFNGKKLTVTDDRNCLVKEGWNDTVSSFKITPYNNINWSCVSDINVPLRKNASGDIECMSQNNKDCLWKSNANECQALLDSPPIDIKPLTCGSMHKDKWGSTGYDNVAHWCSKGKLLL